MSLRSRDDIHFTGGIGASLKGRRYTVLRKLGEGTTSTIWLVRDSFVDGNTIHKYHAAKILSVEATSEPHGPSRERDFLQDLNERRYEEGFDEGSGYTTLLLDSFEHVAPESGLKHLCLISPVFSTSVSALRDSSPHKRLPVYMVRNIVYMALSALKSLHGLGIVHCDVKPDNMLLINHRYTDSDKLEAYLSQNPVQMVAGTQTPESQPFPHGWTHETSAHEAEKMTIALTDFGHAERSEGPPIGKLFYPYALRAPETLLAAGFGSSIDIWAIGCLTFELLTGTWLFNPLDAGAQWSIEENHLAKMQELTGQRFSQEYLSRAGNRDQYFDQSGNLTRIPELTPVSIEQAISNYNIAGLEAEDIMKVSDFIRACLQLDHEQRPSAAKLLEHSFLERELSRVE